MRSAKRFFMIGGYAYSNPGDVAILKATVSRLEAMHPGSHFVIWSDRKEFAVDLAGISSERCIRRCPFFFAGNRLIPRSLLLLYRLFYPLSQKLTQRIWSQQDAPVIQKMKECDFVLFVGGGYINSIFPFDLFQMHYFHCLARQSGTPIILLGQTIGPFKNKWHQKLADTIFDGAERIFLREPYSKTDLGKHRDKIVEGTDDALDFHTTVTDAQARSKELELFDRPDGSGVLLGLNLRYVKNFSGSYPGLLEGLNRFNTEYADGRLKVIFIPMTTGAYHSDRDEATFFKGLSGRNFEFEVLQGPLTVEDRLLAISRTDLLLGMRFHSLVFALSSSVPCLGLYSGNYYMRKNRGLLEFYGMERYCLETHDLSRLTALLGELLKNRDEIRANLKTRHLEILNNKKALYHDLFQHRS